MADGSFRSGQPLLGSLPADPGDQHARLRSRGRGCGRPPGAAGEPAAGRRRGRLPPQAGSPARLRPRGWRGAGRVSRPGAGAPGVAGRAEGPGVVARVPCPRQPRPRRGGRRRAGPGDGPLRARRGAGRPLRGRARRAVLSLDPGADAVLRHLLRLGVVGAADAGALGRVQLARSGLASARAGAGGAVPAAIPTRPPATAGAGRGTGLDGGGARPGGPRGVLLPLRRGPSGALFLRTLPRSLRPRAPQATRGLVHAGGRGALHGRAGGPGAEGRSWHRRRSGGGERLRPRPVLRDGSVSGGSAAPRRSQSRRPGSRGAGPARG